MHRIQQNGKYTGYHNLMNQLEKEAGGNKNSYTTAYI